MTIEKRLTALENKIEEVKENNSEFDENNKRFQILLERMEQQINYCENQIQQAMVNNGELLSVFGIMNQQKKLKDEFIEDDHDNNLLRR